MGWFKTVFRDEILCKFFLISAEWEGWELWE